MVTNYREGDEPVPGSGYRLVRFLGRGGFGEVWKASAPGGAEAAIKIIQLGGAEGRKEFRAFQLVKRIRHPNLVPIIAFWLKSNDGSVLDDAVAEHAVLPSATAPGIRVGQTMVVPRDPTAALQPVELIIAMGLGDRSLTDRLRECLDQGLPGIPQEELLGYMEDAAEAIDFLNRPVHGEAPNLIAVQHCDIKPLNLLIVGGAVQVCDFGLAKMLGAEKSTTGAASLAYAAVECLETGKPSASTDQYSLAITYYELKTGSLPFEEDSLAAVLRAKHDGRLSFTNVTPAEQEVLHKATALAPAARYPTSLAMVKALRQAVAQAGEQGRSARPSGGRAVAVASLLLAIVVVGGAAGVWWKWWRPSPPEPIPLKPTETIAAKTLEKPVLPKTTIKTPPDRPPEKSKAVAEENVKPKPAVPSPSAEEFLARGTQYLQKRQYDQAIAELRSRAAAAAPRDPRIFSRRGSAWMQKKEFPKAVEDFTAAIKISPDARDYVNRSKAYRSLNQLPAAIADATAALGLNRQSAPAYFLRGDIYVSAEDYKKAVDDLSEAIRLASQTPDAEVPLADAYLLRGSAWMSQERLDEAIADFTQAIHAGPSDPGSIYELRANCFGLKNRPDLAKFDSQAAEDYKQLEAKPDDAETRRKLAYLLAAAPDATLRDGKEAMVLATRACELTDWKNAACLDTLAIACAESGRFSDAVKWESKAIELVSDAAVGKLRRARLALFQANKPFHEPSSTLP